MDLAFLCARLLFYNGVGDVFHGDFSEAQTQLVVHPDRPTFSTKGFHFAVCGSFG